MLLVQPVTHTEMKDLMIGGKTKFSSMKSLKKALWAVTSSLSSHLLIFVCCSDFRERHTQTIDEVWYQRAVDMQDKSGTFVYSVPFSDGGGESLGLVALAHIINFSADHVNRNIIPYFQNTKI
jgi:hypothetical protein